MWLCWWQDVPYHHAPGNEFLFLLIMCISRFPFQQSCSVLVEFNIILVFSAFFSPCYSRRVVDWFSMLIVIWKSFFRVLTRLVSVMNVCSSSLVFIEHFVDWTSDFLLLFSQLVRYHFQFPLPIFYKIVSDGRYLYLFVGLMKTFQTEFPETFSPILSAIKYNIILRRCKESKKYFILVDINYLVVVCDTLHICCVLK